MSLLAIVDVETTGLNPWRYDRVIELAGVVLDDSGQVVREFNTLVNPERDLGPVEIHGIEAGDIRQAPRFQEVVGNWLDFLDGVGALAAHNVRFDRSFLQIEFDRMNLEFPPFPSFARCGSRRAVPTIRCRPHGVAVRPRGCPRGGAPVPGVAARRGPPASGGVSPGPHAVADVAGAPGQLGQPLGGPARPAAAPLVSEKAGGAGQSGAVARA